MPRPGRASGYTILPLVLLILFWLLFEELLRRYLSLSPWASVPAGLAACLGFFWLVSSLEDVVGYFTGGDK